MHEFWKNPQVKSQIFFRLKSSGIHATQAGTKARLARIPWFNPNRIFETSGSKRQLVFFEVLKF
tara:strand:+ start:995 stop:1186 length:192 start_codon:yes stop_codon:yes gene_type:complete